MAVARNVMDIMMKRLEALKLECLQMEIGETSREHTCPYCLSDEKAFVVTRTEQGITFFCHRASCGGKGFVTIKPPEPPKPPATPTALLPHKPKNKAAEKVLPFPGGSRRFHERLEPLPQKVAKWLESRYGLSLETMQKHGFKYVPNQHRLFMPIYSLVGEEIGAECKILPQHLTKRMIKNDVPKSVCTYYDRNAPRIHAPKGTISWKVPEVFVTEGILDATKMSDMVNAVSLMGANLGEKEAMMLADHFDFMYLALDPDRAGRNAASKIRKKYSSMFSGIEIVNLKQDPKDTTKDALEEIIFKTIADE